MLVLIGCSCSGVSHSNVPEPSCQICMGSKTALPIPREKMDSPSLVELRNDWTWHLFTWRYLVKDWTWGSWGLPQPEWFCHSVISRSPSLTRVERAYNSSGEASGTGGDRPWFCQVPLSQGSVVLTGSSHHVCAAKDLHCHTWHCWNA